MTQKGLLMSRCVTVAPLVTKPMPVLSLFVAEVLGHGEAR